MDKTEVLPASMRPSSARPGPRAARCPSSRPGPLAGHGPPASSPCATRRVASARRRPPSTSARRSPSAGEGAAARLRPQGALSVGLGVNSNDLDVTIYNLLIERGHDIREIIRPTACPASTSSPPISTCPPPRSSSSVRSPARAGARPGARPVADDYDLILIDCQPSPRSADRQRPHRQPWRAHPAGDRVLRHARRRPARRDDREDHRPAQSSACRHRRHRRDDV